MSETNAPHPDDLAVDRFAAAMKAKLAKKRDEGYGGWDNPEECTIEHLSQLLASHVAKGDPVDVGNLAMMIHQRGGSIAKAPFDPADRKLYGPYGYLNGCRALTEDTWALENDPLENSDEYFSIPLFAKLDVSYPVSVAEPTQATAKEGARRWRVVEAATHGYWGIELERAGNDDDAILYPIKVHRDTVARIVDAHNATVAREVQQ